MKGLDEETRIYNSTFNAACGAKVKTLSSPGGLAQNSYGAFRALEKAYTQSPVTADKT